MACKMSYSSESSDLADISDISDTSELEEGEIEIGPQAAKDEIAGYQFEPEYSDPDSTDTEDEDNDGDMGLCRPFTTDW